MRDKLLDSYLLTLGVIAILGLIFIIGNFGEPKKNYNVVYGDGGIHLP